MVPEGRYSGITDDCVAEAVESGSYNIIDLASLSRSAGLVGHLVAGVLAARKFVHQENLVIFSTTH